MGLEHLTSGTHGNGAGVMQCNGPRRLCDHDDDDDGSMSTLSALGITGTRVTMLILMAKLFSKCSVNFR